MNDDLIYSWLNQKFDNLKKGEKLFIVDLESVSLFSNQSLASVVNDKEKYYKTPFLYLIASYSRNKSLDWAWHNLKYLDKKKTGFWMVYSFEKI